MPLPPPGARCCPLAAPSRRVKLQVPSRTRGSRAGGGGSEMASETMREHVLEVCDVALELTLSVGGVVLDGGKLRPFLGGPASARVVQGRPRRWHRTTNHTPRPSRPPMFLPPLMAVQLSLFEILDLEAEGRGNRRAAGGGNGRFLNAADRGGRGNCTS